MNITNIFVSTFASSLFVLGLLAGLAIDESLQQPVVATNLGTEHVAVQQAISQDTFIRPRSPDELPSPKDRVSEDQIHVYSNRVIIDLRGAEWATFTDTNSMDPVIDLGANAIEMVPATSDEIQVGDIVSYRSSFADGIIIHRIVEIGNDSRGWYARLKGDNNAEIDPGKVRFDQIERVVVAIIY